MTHRIPLTVADMREAAMIMDVVGNTDRAYACRTVADWLEEGVIAPAATLALGQPVTRVLPESQWDIAMFEAANQKMKG